MDEAVFQHRLSIPRKAMEALAVRPMIQRVNQARFHLLRENGVDDLRNKYGLSADLASVGEFSGDWHSFVIEHDYASAFAGASGLSLSIDDIRMPFDRVAWEFNVSGTHVCVCAEGKDVVPWYCFDGGWLPLVGVGVSGFLERQIVAACVALDAGISEAMGVPAPRPNSAERRGRKARRAEYHVVALKGRSARRPRPNAIVLPSRRIRLHFRRGHWRHFESAKKTWVKWTLVGNPDLGFIDKHYRL